MLAEQDFRIFPNCIGKVEKLISCDKCGKVALITEELSETEADSILQKIKNGKSYRLL